MIEVYGINPVRVDPRKVPQWEHVLLLSDQNQEEVRKNCQRFTKKVISFFCKKNLKMILYLYDTL